MAKKRWHAHGGGGNVVVTDGANLWFARQTRDTGPSFRLLERSLLPAAPICAVAVDTNYLVAATGQVSGEFLDRWYSGGDVDLTVLDLPSMSILASKTVPSFGGHLGICAGHVIAWNWVAQGDVLNVDAPMRLDGGTSGYSPDDFCDFDQCDTFEVYGDTMAGSTFYKGVIHLAKPGSKARDVPLPQRYRTNAGFPFLGFDLEGRPVFSYHSKAWVLRDGDEWMKLSIRPSKGKKVAEYAGPDGVPVALKESDLRSATSSPCAGTAPKPHHRAAPAPGDGGQSA